jgi:stress response protein YsnF
VIIERKPLTGAVTADAGTTAFKEEEAKVVKKPVVKEEVNIKKKLRTENEEISGEVKSEELRIKRDEDTDKRKAA